MNQKNEEVKDQDMATSTEAEMKETADSDLEATLDEMQEQAEEAQGESVEEVVALKQKLEQKERESEEYLSRLQRLQADFTNYKKRVEKEKSEIYLYANEKLAVDLLESIDNLERALTPAGEDASQNSIYQGMELVLKQLKEALKKHGVVEIEALGKPFDMNLHHAIMREEADAPADEVIEVFQKGYMIHNKVLRPSMVKVAQ